MNITGTTQITGVMGYPVKHSLSPIFQNAGYEKLGLQYVYIPIKVAPENLEAAIKSIRALNFRGVNLTIPHKKQVLQYLDEISEESQILGVANTIINTNGKLKGDITDGSGFINSLKIDGNFNIKNIKVFMLGAGGSAYAIGGALVKNGIGELWVCNRTEEKSILLKKHISEKLGYKNVYIVPFEKINSKEFWHDPQLLVNTTSIGMNQQENLIIKEENFINLKFVYDIVYNRKTELLLMAEKYQIPCLGGLSMLVYQGAASFKLWTGKEAPIEEMKKSLNIPSSKYT